MELERKSRRRSTHDENRKSLWNYKDMGTMTEKTGKFNLNF